jgi:hypothetical protein
VSRTFSAAVGLALALAACAFNPDVPEDPGAWAA